MIMRRYGLIPLAVAALAWGGLAIVLGSPSLRLAGSSARSGVSPACLPGTLEHTAALPGTDVDVSPEPETGTANPRTQISFLGTNVANIQEVSGVGSERGQHHGHIHGYNQGDGASFQPDAPFDTGERVSVSAVIGPRGQGHRTSFSF